MKVENKTAVTTIDSSDAIRPKSKVPAKKVIKKVPTVSKEKQSSLPKHKQLQQLIQIKKPIAPAKTPGPYVKTPRKPAAIKP